MSLETDHVDSTVIGVSLNVVPGKPIRKHYSYTWDVNTSKCMLSATFSTLNGNTQLPTGPKISLGLDHRD